MRSHRIRVVAPLLAVALAAGGFLLGGRVGLSPVSPGAKGEPEPDMKEPIARPVACDAEGIRSHLRELEHRLLASAPLPASISSSAAGQVRDRPEACPSPPPVVEDVPLHRTAEEFRSAAANALEECATGLSLQEVDCSESPCIAWALGDAARPGRVDLGECGPWRSSVARREMVTVRAMGASGDLYFALMPVPVDGDVAGIVRRYPERVQALAESWRETRSGSSR